MADFENDIYYVEILKTLNEKNLYIQNQEQNIELKQKFEESSKKYSELRNVFLNMKDVFESNQIQMFKSFTLLSDSRDQYKSQITELEEYQKQCDFLIKKSLAQQVEFDNIVKNWNNKIEELSLISDGETETSKIQNGQSNVDSLLKEIEIIQNRNIEEDKISPNTHMLTFLEGVKQTTDELMSETKNYEETLKYCNELEIEINEYGAIIDDIQKQLH